MIPASGPTVHVSFVVSLVSLPLPAFPPSLHASPLPTSLVHFLTGRMEKLTGSTLLARVWWAGTSFLGAEHSSSAVNKPLPMGVSHRLRRVPLFLSQSLGWDGWGSSLVCTRGCIVANKVKVDSGQSRGQGRPLEDRGDELLLK